MSPEIEALARRAVACVPIERWPDWTPVLITRCEPEIRGALITNGPIRYVIDEEGSGWFFDGSGCGNPGAIPLLDTPAGLGCLLALVRESLNDPNLCTLTLYGVKWTVFSYEAGHVRGEWDGSTSEAEALISALEAAP